MTDRGQYAPGPAGGAQARRAAARSGPRAGKADGEAAVLAKIARDAGAFLRHGRARPCDHPAQRAGAPAGLWYGMPGYAKDGKTVCFFRADKKYMTFGLTPETNLTRGEDAPRQLMECAWYFTALDDATEARLSTIAHKAAS